jgi:2-desacetyl-2-hydroxyethyl bacteriochlorophyllide A dehydrogenase
MRQIGIEYPARGEMGFCELGPPTAPGPAQILLETCFSGITNGTERHALMADHGYGAFPGRHGYQHVARVAAVGSEVRAFAPGDTVFYGQYVGHRGWHLVEVGGAAVPSSIASHLTIRLPEDVDREECALLGVAGVALRAVKRVRVAPGQKVWVVGAGPIGHFAAQAARVKGARVTVTDLVPGRLAAVRAAVPGGEDGSIDTIDARGEESWEALKAAGPFERIIDASGVESLLYDIHRHGLLASRGVIAAMAVRGEVRFPWSLLHGREASIEVACHFSLEELAELIDLLRAGRLRIGPMVSHRVPIAEAPSIYSTMRDRPRDLLGVLFDWS